MRITARELRQIIREELGRGTMNEAPSTAAVAAVKRFVKRRETGLSSAEMTAAKQTLADALAAAGCKGAEAIRGALEEGGMGGDGAFSFAEELAGLQ